ncbi:MAG: DNA polymerase III subunit gamma/tau, partial [Mycobacterium sp.]
PQPEPAPPAPAPAAVVTPGEPDAAAVRATWATVRDKVRQRSRSTEAMLAGATVRTVDGNTLVLTHETASLARRLSEPRNTDVITEALKDALGVNWRVRCEAGGPAPEAGHSAAPAAVDVESARRADEEAMLAEAAVDAGSDAPPRRDPEEVALELLQNELGARPIRGD